MKHRSRLNLRLIHHHWAKGRDRVQDTTSEEDTTLNVNERHSGRRISEVDAKLLPGRQSRDSRSRISLIEFSCASAVICRKIGVWDHLLKNLLKHNRSAESRSWAVHYRFRREIVITK
jgi:hypothetical protein